jgi:hypothetical protein
MLTLQGLCDVLACGLADTSTTAARLACQAVRTCLPYILASDGSACVALFCSFPPTIQLYVGYSFGLELAQQLLSLTSSKYWLIKVRFDSFPVRLPIFYKPGGAR